jgi:SAM-dependent methyltransferase
MNSDVNYWFEPRCARAFWSQHELPPYQELLAATSAWLDPAPGERWLDLGCGSGQLTRALWEKSDGRLHEIVAVDGASVHAEAYARLRASIQPRPAPEHIRFTLADFAAGFPAWRDGSFDGVVCGLALQYAASYDAATGRWTQAGYDRVLSEVSRLLRPGGRFIFSVNVPAPAWGRVARQSLAGALHQPRPLRYLKKCWRMWSYGRWLTQQSRLGRFHYLPLRTIEAKLSGAGLAGLDYQLSYAGQAYLCRVRKPAAGCVHPSGAAESPAPVLAAAARPAAAC